MNLFPPEIKRAFLSGLPVDAIFLTLGTIVMDEGIFGAALWNAVIAAMVMKGYIVLRRPRNLTKFDLVWIRSGSVFMIPVSIAASLYFVK